ncbi:hypothetical protein SAMN04488518_11371 [Pseudovibrio ascidiaceicola]|uniref:Phage abortive infection protein n=2 Tax=Pseudovibrio ascidiaceicola TaxID=285279 RepID=A0A1I4E008_9HYPH|nr:hypothetical protein SAMN04488518_11371 [Pseudovibrio ascidiaceicola]
MKITLQYIVLAAIGVAIGCFYGAATISTWGGGVPENAIVIQYSEETFYREWVSALGSYAGGLIALIGIAVAWVGIKSQLRKMQQTNAIAELTHTFKAIQFIDQEHRRNQAPELYINAMLRHYRDKTPWQRAYLPTDGGPDFAELITYRNNWLHDLQNTADEANACLPIKFIHRRNALIEALNAMFFSNSKSSDPAHSLSYDFAAGNLEVIQNHFSRMSAVDTAWYNYFVCLVFWKKQLEEQQTVAFNLDRVEAQMPPLGK